MGGCKMGYHFALVFYACAVSRRYFGKWSNCANGSIIPLSNNSTNQTKQLVRIKQNKTY